MFDIDLQDGGKRKVPIGRTDNDLVCGGELFREVEHRIAPIGFLYERYPLLDHLPVERCKVAFEETHFFNGGIAFKIGAAKRERARFVVSAGIDEKGGHRSFLSCRVPWKGWVLNAYHYRAI